MRVRGFTVWLTGLSGAGKSTISGKLAEKLREKGLAKIEVLDGDFVRTNLSKGLGFSKEDRDTNILRIGFVCELLTNNDAVAIAAAISPYREIRDAIRARIGNFVEVYVKAPIETLVERDVKGLYKKALSGEIKNFTGISDPYEPPLNPEVVLETDHEDVGTSVNKLLRALELLGCIGAAGVPLSKDEEEKVIGQLRSSGRMSAVSRTTLVSAAKLESVPILPHGGVLVNRLLSGPELAENLGCIQSCPSLFISPKQWSDIELIATGAYSPVTGFVGERDYRSIILNGRLGNGLAWTVPIQLLVSQDEAERLKGSERIALRDKEGLKLAILNLSETYRVDKKELAQAVWQTTDTSHPGVKNLFYEGNVALAGDIDVLRFVSDEGFAEFRLTPAETRKYFREKGWNSVAGFQTHNPIHRAHEYLQKIALESVDGLLLHTLVGESGNDHIPASVRMDCYSAILENYYPADRVLLSVMPAGMLYAGPKDAIHHAIIRQNYGCTHFIVGRDDAGVGKYYGTYDAQKIFDLYSKEELAITPLKFENTFYCKRCDGMASDRTCPHGAEDHVLLSGTQVREYLKNGLELPREFSRPEVAAVLRRYFDSICKSH